MKFKVKVITPTGSEKIEENNAPNEGKLKELYEMMGYTLVDILDTQKEKGMFDGLDAETMNKINQMNGKVPNLGAGGSFGKTNIPEAPKKPEYREYTDNGINYRVELNSGVLQKQDWVKLNNDELKDISTGDNGKMVSAYTQKLKLFRLQWVNLG